MGLVFVYLMDDDDAICYWRGNAVDFTDPDPQHRWISLKNDKAIGKVDELHEAGMIQLKLSICNLQHTPDPIWNQYKAWAHPPPKRLSTYKIRAFIFQC